MNPTLIALSEKFTGKATKLRALAEASRKIRHYSEADYYDQCATVWDAASAVTQTHQCDRVMVGETLFATDSAA